MLSKINKKLEKARRSGNKNLQIDKVSVLKIINKVFSLLYVEFVVLVN